MAMDIIVPTGIEFASKVDWYVHSIHITYLVHGRCTHTKFRLNPFLEVFPFFKDFFCFRWKNCFNIFVGVLPLGMSAYKQLPLTITLNHFISRWRRMMTTMTSLWTPTVTSWSKSSRDSRPLTTWSDIFRGRWTR